MASETRTRALRRPRVFTLAAFVLLTATTTSAVAQSADALLRPATPLDVAIVQIARFYRQPIGFEQITGDVSIVGVSPVDLSVMTVDQALQAVVARAGRAYRVERLGADFSVRPAESMNDAESWLNHLPEAPGLVSTVYRNPPNVPGGPYYRTINSLEFDAHVAADLRSLTLGESWLELQRPGTQRKAFLPAVRTEEQRWQQFEEDVRRRVTVESAANVWDAIAAAMVAHGGVTSWTLSHRAPRATQGETSLTITGTAGWSMTFTGVRPAQDVADAMVPNFKERMLKEAAGMLPSVLPSPPASR